MTAGLLSVILYVQLAAFAPPVSAQVGLAWPDYWQADPAFFNVWSRGDAPVAMRAAQRSWLWGPAPFAVANESYAESPSGQRLVEYMDKARMEVNDPSADRGSPWFVTSGLLVYEMVSGQVQTGNNRYEARSPAALPVAGDAASPDAPTYADFAQYTGPSQDETGVIVTQRISKGGTVSSLSDQEAPTDPSLFGISYFDSVSKHNVPAVFASWMNQTATVLQNGHLVQAALIDPLYVLGRPISEPYWADVLVAGAPTRVLMQLYERRALTYNPNNPPGWRVEMANVGRAYYDWRYSGKSLAPAIAATVGDEAVVVRGWNWPPAATVRAQINMSGAQQAISGPQEVRADAAGRFSTVLPMNTQLQSALLSNAGLQVKASGPPGSAALPLVGKVVPARAQLAGVITQLDAGVATPRRATLQARDGGLWTLSMGDSAQLRYSEGNPAPGSALVIGASVLAAGTTSGRSVAVDSLTMLSVSGSGAQLSYALQPDGNPRISGTGWPGEHDVVFSIGPLGASGTQIGTAQADSRGILSAQAQIPPNVSWPPGPLWLYASASNQGTVAAQVALPFAPGGAEGAGPPALDVGAASGDQAAGVGSYCWQDSCADAIGTPLPGNPLKVNPGESLEFHSQYGPDPNAGLTPNSFSAQLFAYPANLADEGTALDGVYYYSPKSLPLRSTGQQPGRPFSLSLPPSMPAGQYALVVTVTWPGWSGKPQSTTYGFTLQVP